MTEARREPRQPKRTLYSVISKHADGTTSSIAVLGLDISASGIGVETPGELEVGEIVLVRSVGASTQQECEVVYCTRRGEKFRAGLAVRNKARQETKSASEERRMADDADHYETLQISRKADFETIHRVFRIMAARFHPDNPDTGDVERFLRMRQAYSILSDPARRAEYDYTLEGSKEGAPRNVFALKDFVVGVESESNRRLGALCLLYRRRQTDPHNPGIALLDLERDMGFPREYLTFSMWYLLAKGFITVGDSSDYTITAEGADYVEGKAISNEVVGKLLDSSGQVRKPSAKADASSRRGAATPYPELLPASR